MSTSSTSSHQDHCKESNTWLSIPVRVTVHTVSDVNMHYQLSLSFELAVRGNRTPDWVYISDVKKHYELPTNFGTRLNWDLQAHFHQCFLTSFASQLFHTLICDRCLFTVLVFIKCGRHGYWGIICTEFIRYTVLNMNFNTNLVYFEATCESII